MHEVKMPDVATRPGDDQTSRLMDEISILERRLEGMGMDGDCAYERSLSRVYTGLIEAKKCQLAEVKDNLPTASRHGCR